MAKSRFVPVTADGRLTIRIGRMTARERDELYATMGNVVAFTRSGPPPASDSSEPPRSPKPQPPEWEALRPDERRRTAP